MWCISVIASNDQAQKNIANILECHGYKFNGFFYTTAGKDAITQAYFAIDKIKTDPILRNFVKLFHLFRCDEDSDFTQEFGADVDVWKQAEDTYIK